MKIFRKKTKMLLSTISQLATDQKKLPGDRVNSVGKGN